MKTKFTKVHSFLIPESFIQVNFIRGFKYIDRAGEIVNNYHHNDTPPVFQMNLSGLVIEKPTKEIEEMKISSGVFWTKFTNVNALDIASTAYCKEVEAITKILDVTEINRIGWRTYFIYEFKNETEYSNFFSRFNKEQKIKTTTVKMLITENGFSINYSLENVVKNNDTKKTAVLFDVDIYTATKIHISEIKTKLREFREYLNDSDKGLLAIINKSF